MSLFLLALVIWSGILLQQILSYSMQVPAPSPLSNVSAATTDVNLGAGIIDLNHCILQNASFEVGMGELNYSGVIRGDLTADCGMGSLTFAFIDSEQKHNYSLDGSMGSISIGDKDMGIGIREDTQQ